MLIPAFIQELSYMLDVCFDYDCIIKFLNKYPELDIIKSNSDLITVQYLNEVYFIHFDEFGIASVKYKINNSELITIIQFDN